METVVSQKNGGMNLHEILKGKRTFLEGHIISDISAVV
jgi:hypothetical protein